MTLIRSISGIRGTLGGKPGDSLSAIDLTTYSMAFAMWLKEIYPESRLKVLIGRDARSSGPLVARLVAGSLQAMGVDVVDAGITTTPTVAMGVTHLQANGGIMISASHNPRNWNALKLMDDRGEFLTAAQAERLYEIAANPASMNGATVDRLGRYEQDEGLLEMHISRILELPLIDVEAIRNAGFTVVVDGVNSSGGIAIPMLLEHLGVKKVVEVFCEPNGVFPHNPEPLPEHLGELSSEVVARNAHLGLAVDPDVDRLAIVCEDGEVFGEEYTLVAVADYVLSHTKGAAVSNLSSTRALKEVAESHDCSYFSSAVGEVNVVARMRETHAVIGGEGNGGVIYPALHYGRDALVGTALFLTHLARHGKSCSSLKLKYPRYEISKNKAELPPEADLSKVLEAIALRYHKHKIDRTDGIRIDFGKEWVHLRRSNTEPIIRIYAESDSMVKAENLADKIKDDIRDLLKGESSFED